MCLWGEDSPRSEQEEGGDWGMRPPSRDEEEDMDSWMSTLDRLLKSSR